MADAHINEQFTEVDLRCATTSAAKLARKKLELELTLLAFTLMQSHPRNRKAMLAIAELKERPIQQQTTKRRRYPSIEVEDFGTLVFYPKDAKSMMRDGKRSRRDTVKNVRRFAFVGTVTVTRRPVRNYTQFTFETEQQRLVVEERGTKRLGFRYHVLVADGFKKPSGRAAGGRMFGRDPRLDVN